METNLRKQLNSRESAETAHPQQLQAPFPANDQTTVQHIQQGQPADMQAAPALAQPTKNNLISLFATPIEGELLDALSKMTREELLNWTAPDNWRVPNHKGLGWQIPTGYTIWDVIFEYGRPKAFVHCLEKIGHPPEAIYNNYLHLCAFKHYNTIKRRASCFPVEQRQAQWMMDYMLKSLIYICKDTKDQIIEKISDGFKQKKICDDSIGEIKKFYSNLIDNCLTKVTFPANDQTTVQHIQQGQPADMQAAPALAQPTKNNLISLFARLKEDEAEDELLDALSKMTNEELLNWRAPNLWTVPNQQGSGWKIPTRYTIWDVILEYKRLHALWYCLDRIGHPPEAIYDDYLCHCAYKFYKVIESPDVNPPKENIHVSIIMNYMIYGLMDAYENTENQIIEKINNRIQNVMSGGSTEDTKRFKDFCSNITIVRFPKNGISCLNLPVSKEPMS